MTLTEFLLARIAEDEAAANYASTGVRWESWNRSWDSEPQRDIAGGGVRLFTVPTLYDEHIARHDPARVLRECEAKRRIVEMHQPWQAHGYGDPITCCDECGPFEDIAFRAPQGNHPCPTLRTLAAVWSDHVDYDERWKP